MMLKSNTARNDDSVPQNTPYSNNNSIQTMVNNYRYFERQCDAATDQLEQRAKEIVRRVEGDMIVCNSGLVAGDCNRLDAPPPASLADVQFARGTKNKDEFSYRAQLARKYCIPYRVMSGTNFIEGATEHELQELEEMEVQISLLQFQLQQTESGILETVPTDADDALAKLKFISALLIDGCHIEVDHFAYVVKEASEQCERDLQSILETYKKHESIFR